MENNLAKAIEFLDNEKKRFYDYVNNKVFSTHSHVYL